MARLIVGLHAPAGHRAGQGKAAPLQHRPHMHRHAEGNGQPGHQMDAIHPVIELALAQPVFLHQLAAAHRQGQGQQGHGVGRLLQAPPANADGIDAKQQGHRPEQDPGAAVEVDPVAADPPGQATPAAIEVGVHQQPTQPGQGHQNSGGPVQQPQQGRLVGAAHRSWRLQSTTGARGWRDSNPRQKLVVDVVEPIGERRDAIRGDPVTEEVAGHAPLCCIHLHEQGSRWLSARCAHGGKGARSTKAMDRMSETCVCF